MALSSALMFCLTLLTCHFNGGAAVDLGGRSFLLAFPPTLDWMSTEVRVVITAQMTSEVRLMAPGLDQDIIFSVAAMTSHHVTLSSDFIIHSNLEVERIGVWLGSTEKISVYCYLLHQNASESYLALPVATLGTRYLVVTYDALGKDIEDQLVVAAIENDTVVEITLRTSSSILCGANRYRSGHTFQFVLNTYDVVRLGCKKDLTGSEVTATKPVAVFSGNQCTRVPIRVKYCNYVVEMLPPASAFGRDFILSYIEGRRSGSIYRVVAGEDGTNLRTSDGWTSSLQKGDFQEISVSHKQRLCLNSNKPVLVMRFSKSKESDPVDPVGGPFMMVVPPIDRFASDYILDTRIQSSGQSADHFLEVMVPDNTSGTSGLVSGLQRLEACGVWVGASQVSSGVLPLLDAMNGTVGILQYGLFDREAFGHPAGYRLEDFSGLDECASSPCQNGGTCYQTALSYQCMCPRQGLGPNCQEDTTTTSVIEQATSFSVSTTDLSSTPTMDTSSTSTELLTRYTSLGSSINLVISSTTDFLSTFITPTTSSIPVQSSTAEGSSFQFTEVTSTPETAPPSTGSSDSLMEESITSFLSTIITPATSSIPVQSSTDGVSSFQFTEVTSTPETAASSTGSSNSLVEKLTTDFSSSTMTPATSFLPVLSSTADGSSFKFTEVTSTSEAVASSSVDDESSSAVTSFPATSTPSTWPPAERCACRCKGDVAQQSARGAAVLEAEDLVKNLSVPVSKLSSFRRQRISAPDQRPSATRMGGVGIAILVVVFGSIIAADVYSLIAFGCRIARRYLRGRSKKQDA